MKRISLTTNELEALELGLVQYGNVITFDQLSNFFVDDRQYTRMRINKLVKQGWLKRIKKGGFRRMALLKRHLRKPDLFLAPSRELLLVPFDIPAEKIFIPNGVDGSKFLFSKEKRARIRSQLGIGREDIVGLITRRLVDKNGVIYLARAAKFLKNKKIRFIIIGDGPERAQVEKEFKKGAREKFGSLISAQESFILNFNVENLLENSLSSSSACAIAV